MKKIGITLLLLILWSIATVGCAGKKTSNGHLGSADSDAGKEIYAESVKLADAYKEVYKKANQDGTLASLEVRQKMVKALGEEGYSTVDTDNQIDMVHADQVEEFVKQAKSKKTGNVTILCVQNDGGFMRYDLTTEDGKIDIQRSALNWKDGKATGEDYDLFPSYTWDYTDKGYLMLEEELPEVYDGAPGQIAIRVKSLDASLREMNQKYVLPLGYYTNNLLISNWNETQVGEIDFYDLYETTYQMKHGKPIPYGEGFGGDEYQIPKEEFEEPIQSYFKIDSSLIEQSCTYNQDTKTYRYRPRGLYDSQLPYGPYPEVMASETQPDGTIKLTIEGVWTRKKTDHAVTSELVVRPLEDGTYQYVSNQLLAVEDGIELIHIHDRRLTDEKWEEDYK